MNDHQALPRLFMEGQDPWTKKMRTAEAKGELSPEPTDEKANRQARADEWPRTEPLEFRTRRTRLHDGVTAPKTNIERRRGRFFLGRSTNGENRADLISIICHIPILASTVFHVGDVNPRAHPIFRRLPPSGETLCHQWR